MYLLKKKGLSNRKCGRIICVKQKLNIKNMKIYIIKCFVVSFFLVGITLGCANKRSQKDSGKEIVLRLEPSNGNPRNSEGDFIQLKDGSILFMYTHFTSGTGDNATAHLAGRFSYDHGKTWTSKDVKILSNEGGMNIMSVSLLRLENDDIALFYLRKNSETDCIPFMRISTDEAKTWSEPKRCIPNQGYHVVNNDRFLQLVNGRIIFSTSLHTAPVWSKGKIFSYYSDDNGGTWRKSEQVANPENITLQEPGIVELKNGNLMLFCRTESGVQYFSFSDDHGETWSEIEPGNIRSPLSPASIERIPSTGDLLLLWNNNYEKGRDGGKRTPFSLAISKNEGKTWEKIKTVESDPAGWYCYTAIDFTDNHILLGHCAGDTKTNNGLSTTQITRLSLDWVYKEATSEPTVKFDNETLVLTCSDKNTQIRYTLDGSLPSEDTGLIYRDPIVIDSLTPLYMQAFHMDKTPSKIVYKQVGSHIFQSAQEVTFNLKQGLYFNYFEDSFDQTSEIDSSIVIKSGVISQFSIEESKILQNFAYVFDGYIKINEDGLYTFYLESNDGSVLFLNDHKLIDNDGAHGIYTKSVSTSLRKGLHRLKVKYFQKEGGKSLKVLWDGSDFKKEEIPESVLYHKEELVEK